MTPLLTASLLGAGLGVLGGIGGQLTPAAFRERKELKEDIKKMRAGKLGISDATKAQMVGQAQQQALAQQEAQAAELRRMAAAGGLTGGAAQQALQAQAAQAPQIAAQAMADANAQSQALAEQRRQSILARMSGQQAKGAQAIQTAAQLAAVPAMGAVKAAYGVGPDWESQLRYLLGKK